VHVVEPHNIPETFHVDSIHLASTQHFIVNRLGNALFAVEAMSLLMRRETEEEISQPSTELKCLLCNDTGVARGEIVAHARVLWRARQCILVSNEDVHAEVVREELAAFSLGAV